VSWLQAIDVPPPVIRQPKPRRRKPQVLIKVARPGRRGRPVQWGRMTYETIKECAADVGLSIWAVRRRLGIKG
jgi:CTP:molybdopterin cytidylyltransferase MocA